MPYSTLQQAQDGALRDEDALEIAANVVQRLAPAPSPEPADYAPKAARAEREVYDYLINTRGGVTNSSRSLDVLRTGATYAGFSEVKRRVREAMGDYYVGGKTMRIL